MQKEYNDFPFIAEALAVDISNSLSGAVIGIRGFRNRKLFKRVFDGLTGKNNEFLSQSLGDLVVSQQAITGYIKLVTDAEIHTQRCLIQVTKNLVQAIADLKETNTRVAAINNGLTEKLEAVYQELKLRIDSKVERLEILNWVTSKFQAGELYKGFSIIFRSALYIAYVYNLYAGESKEVLDRQLMFAKNKVKVQLKDQQQPSSITAILTDIINSTAGEILPMAIFITAKPDSSFLKINNVLFLRKIAELPIDDNTIRENLKMIEVVAEDKFLASAEIFTAFQCAEKIADDLIYGFDKRN